MRCENCHALLTPGAGFCLSCKQPLRDVEENRPTPGPVSARQAEEADALEALRTAPPRKEIPMPASRLSERIALPKTEYSRTKAGPTSFPLWGKIALTAVIIFFAPYGWGALMGLFLVTYVPIAGLLLWGIWRKQRVG